MWRDAEDEDGEREAPRTDPRTLPVALDANALQGNGKDARRRAVARFLALAQQGALRVFIGEAVRTEWTQAGGADRGPLPQSSLAAPRRGLTPGQHLARIRVRAIVCGHARPGKHDADALHLSEAFEAGCGYFVTYDSRILQRRADLESIAVPPLRIVTLEDYLDLVDPAAGAPGEGPPSP